MNKIRILPVYPRSPPSFWSHDKSLELVGKKASMPPTGLLTAAAKFPESYFEFLPLQDLNIQPLDEEAVKATDYIATSSMVIHAKSHDQIINIAHKHGKKVIAGGPFPTASPERNANADYIVAGEGELTIAPFIKDLLYGSPKHIYTEADAINSHTSQLTKGKKPILSETPIPRWDLVPDLNVYNSVGIQYSRGCPFDCEFCNITSLFGREPRTKTPEQMIKEFDTVLNRGYKGNIFLVDDNLIGNLKNLKQFLPKLIEWQKQHNYPYELYTEASVNLAWPENKKVLEDLVDAGMDMVFLGIETIDPDMIKSMNKKQNLKMHPREAVKILQNAGLEVSSGFIIGTDGEKKTVFDNLYNFIQESGIMVPMVGLLTAAPGTKLYNRLISEGRLRKESTGSNTHTFEFNFEPKLEKGFSENELIEGYKHLLQKLFDPKNYYERCKVHLRELGEKTYTRPRINLEGFGILGRFIKDQLTGNWDTETMKHITSTLIKSPKNFSGAVTQGVKFKHYKYVTKASLVADAYGSKVEGWYERFKHSVESIQNKYSVNISRLNQNVSKKASQLVQKAERAYHKNVSKKANQLVQKAEKAYHKVHPDFSSKARRVLEELKQKIASKEYISVGKPKTT